MGKIFYISDTHFGHKNCIRFDGRPFETVDEMDRVLIENWNRKVTDEDTVYILGDFIYRSGRTFEWYLKQLKGRKILVAGNHDWKLLEDENAKQYYECIGNLVEIEDGDKHIILCHYPLAEWNGSRRKWNRTYHIFGHIHADRGNSYWHMATEERAFNAGCMINNYEPVTFEELAANNREWQKLNRV